MNPKPKTHRKPRRGADTHKALQPLLLFMVSQTLTSDHGWTPNQPESKLLKGGDIGAYRELLYVGVIQGILGVQTIA